MYTFLLFSNLLYRLQTEGSSNDSTYTTTQTFAGIRRIVWCTGLTYAAAERRPYKDQPALQTPHLLSLTTVEGIEACLHSNPTTIVRCYGSPTT